MKNKTVKKPSSKTQFKEKVNVPKERMPWSVALKVINRRLFKILSPQGHGTGFHIGNFGDKKGLCAVATALHVVDHSNEWGESIKLIHESSKKIILLKEGERVIYKFPKSDLAIIIFSRLSNLPVPDEEISYLQSDKCLNPGVEIGWCGFPAIRREQLCFFHGVISCYLEEEDGYLADGVAINGVSGGPVFSIDRTTNSPIIVGVISAYIPNRNTRDTLPGVSMISSIPTEYEQQIISFRNLESAGQEVKKAEKTSDKEDK